MSLFSPIATFELFHLQIPLAKPYKLSRLYGIKATADVIILKFTLEDGTIGYGEADPHTPFTEETPQSIISAIRDYFAPKLIGAFPHTIRAHNELMDALLPLNYMAKGAVDMALYDLCGKCLNIPASQLLGGRIHDQIPLLWPLGNGTAQDDLPLIEEKQAQGFQSFMLKMGNSPIAQEITRLETLYDHFGDDLALVVDANQGWSLKDSLLFTQYANQTPLILLEQPVRKHLTHDLKSVKENASFMVSADESLSGKEEMIELVRNDCVDLFSLKVSKNGGITKTKCLADIAFAAHKPVLMNSMLEFGITQAASLQLGQTLPHLNTSLGHAYMSVLRMSDDFTDLHSQIHNGTIMPNDKPGLGIAVDEEKIRRLAQQTLMLET